MPDFSVRLVANYSSGCFCDKPELKPGKPFKTKPTFQFKKQVQIYAAENGITDIQIYKTSGSSATGLIAFKCKHRNIQSVHIDYDVVYPENSEAQNV